MNPKKIGISQPWSSRSMSCSLKEEIWMRSLIEGIFHNYNYLCSEIYVNCFPSRIELHFLLFIPGGNSLDEKEDLKSVKEHNWRLSKIVQLIKSILILKYNINVEMNIKRTPNVFKDGKILSSWLKSQIEKDPLKVLPTLRKTVKSRGKLRGRVRVGS